MRPADEILARMGEIKGRDWLGTEQGDLINALPFDAAKPYLNDGVTAEQWAEARETDPVKCARDYLEFAWGKANNCRGISAGRSVNHFQAWLWLAGVDDFDRIAEGEYRYYGKPVLVVVSEALGVDWRVLDDADWRNDECGEGERPTDTEIARLVALAEPIKTVIDSHAQAVS